MFRLPSPCPSQYLPPKYLLKFGIDDGVLVPEPLCGLVGRLLTGNKSHERRLLSAAAVKED
jgi:hypothetical protein